ncbi:MAG TPA: peptide deformylase [Candidatus Cloacimonetes bacterium]|nr:peptide deformylase [Candidatus Cloacimonadota bacterium]
MTLREVVKLPDEILRRKAHPVKNFDGNFQSLVDDMIETMRDEPGVGLAAPQVNISLRLIVVEYPVNDEDENAEPSLFVLANPEFKMMSENKVMGIEGCLSVPNIVGDVERSEEIIIEGVNRRGEIEQIHAKGWLARIFQHEMDHINGILFVDRAETLYQTQETEADIKNV